MLVNNETNVDTNRFIFLFESCSTKNNQFDLVNYKILFKTKVFYYKSKTFAKFSYVLIETAGYLQCPCNQLMLKYKMQPRYSLNMLANRTSD